MPIFNKELGTYSSSYGTPAASGTTYSAPINLSDFPDAISKLLICTDYPAMTTAQLPNASAVTFNLVTSNSSSLNPILNTYLLGTQIGASSTGATSGTFAIKPPITGGKYYGIQCTASGSTLASSVAQAVYIVVK